MGAVFSEARNMHNVRHRGGNEQRYMYMQNGMSCVNLLYITYLNQT